MAGSSSSHRVYVCVGFATVTVLFVVSRYYIRADSFPSFCFSSASLSVVHDFARDILTLSISACCLPVCVKSCVLCVFLCVQR